MTTFCLSLWYSWSGFWYRAWLGCISDHCGIRNNILLLWVPAPERWVELLQVVRNNHSSSPKNQRLLLRCLPHSITQRWLFLFPDHMGLNCQWSSASYSARYTHGYHGPQRAVSLGHEAPGPIPPLTEEKRPQRCYLSFHKVHKIRWAGTGEILIASWKDQATLNPLLDIRDSTEVSLKAQMERRWGLAGSQTHKTSYLTVLCRQANKTPPTCVRAEGYITTSEAAFHNV